MALKFVSKTVEPVTLELALRYRDMRSVNNERPLQAVRAKTQVNLISHGEFNGMEWGECELNGVTYRGNGNHSSHVLVACIQAHTDSGLDDKSEEFFKTYLAKGRGPWKGDAPTDLPEVRPGELVASIERYTADSDVELAKFFKRYDPAWSARRASDVINIYAGEHDCLRRLPSRLVNKAVLGTAAAIKDDPRLAGLPTYAVPPGSGEVGILLREPVIRECVRWLVEEVTDSTLYSSTEAAAVCVEAYFQHGPESASAILMEILRQADADDNSPGAAFYSLLTRRRPKPTRTSIMARGRKAIKSIAEKLEEALV